MARFNCNTWKGCSGPCTAPADFRVWVDTVFGPVKTPLEGGAEQWSYGYSLSRTCCEETLQVSFYDEDNPTAFPVVTLDGWSLSTAVINPTTGNIILIREASATFPPPLRYRMCGREYLQRFPSDACDCFPDLIKVQAEFEAIQLGDTSVRLFWGGIGCTPGSYIVRYRQVGAAQWQALPDIPTATAVLTGLSPLVDYEWSVQSVCGNCLGTVSDTQTFILSATCFEQYGLSIPNPVLIELPAESGDAQPVEVFGSESVPDACCDTATVIGVDFGDAVGLSAPALGTTFALGDGDPVVFTFDVQSDGTTLAGDYLCALLLQDCYGNDLPPVLFTVLVEEVVPCLNPFPIGYWGFSVQIASADPGSSFGFTPPWPAASPLSCAGAPYAVAYDDFGSISAFVQGIVDYYTSLPGTFGTVFGKVLGPDEFALIFPRSMLDAAGAACGDAFVTLCLDGVDADFTVEPTCGSCSPCSEAYAGIPAGGSAFSFRVDAVPEGEGVGISLDPDSCPDAPALLRGVGQSLADYVSDLAGALSNPPDRIAVVSDPFGDPYTITVFYTPRPAACGSLPDANVCGTSGGVLTEITVAHTCANCGWQIGAAAYALLYITPESGDVIFDGTDTPGLSASVDPDGNVYFDGPDDGSYFSDPLSGDVFHL